MKITICGSAAFADEMEATGMALEKMGHEAKFPPATATLPDGTEIRTTDYYKLKKGFYGQGEEKPADGEWFRASHTERIRGHFDKVAWSDAVLILNEEKNGIHGYIGPNTLMEMGLAFHLQKKIYLLRSVPDISWKEEILGMQPIVIEGDLLRIA